MSDESSHLDKGYLAPLYARMDQQDTVLREIRTALVGDTFGNKGLVGRADTCDKERLEIKAQLATHDRKIWVASLALSVIWTAVLAYKDRIFK